MSVSDKRICHITTLHQRNDVRIFLKECRSLANDFETYLIVADGKGDETIDNVKIIDAGVRSKSLTKRLWKTTSSVYKKASELDCNIYHFHDPEFIFYGYKLTREGKKVIYDAHEDLPRQILNKQYISPIIRPIISKVTEIIEDYFSKYFCAVVASTPKIKERFIKINSMTIDVCNYVITKEFQPSIKYSDKDNKICYIGGITDQRGIRELLLSLSNVNPDFKLELAGKIDSPEFEREIRTMENWERVNYHGFVGRKNIFEILKSSKIGILTLYPTPSYIYSLPVKLFEYMAAGIPIIASDFPLWKSIIEANECGICVNPHNPSEISNALEFLIDNPATAESMGNNGYSAVVEKYNWDFERKKLLNLYYSLY